MARQKDNLPLALGGAALALFLLFDTIWSILFEDWLKLQLERFVGHTVAEMLERFGSVGFPVLGATAVVWLLYSYLKAHLRAEMGIKAEPEPRREVAATTIDPRWSRDLLLSEALWRVYNGDWSGRIDLSQEHYQDAKVLKLWDAAVALRQHAFDGTLPIWARRQKSTLYEPVPNEFWSNHEIEVSTTINSTIADTWVLATHPLVIGEVRFARAKDWEGFMTCREAVESLWTPKP
jgi:hypothetical protein